MEANERKTSIVRPSWFLCSSVTTKKQIARKTANLCLLCVTAAYSSGIYSITNTVSWKHLSSALQFFIMSNRNSIFYFFSGNGRCCWRIWPHLLGTEKWQNTAAQECQPGGHVYYVWYDTFFCIFIIQHYTTFSLVLLLCFNYAYLSYNTVDNNV